MKRLLTLLLVLATAMIASAQQAKSFDIDLWPDGLPNSNGIDKTQPYNDETRNFKPMIRVYLPDSARTDMAILVCPGGGYRVLSNSHEGHMWADILVPQGIATIVLSYRMPMGVTEVPISDATEAMRLIREHAQEWGIDPQKVGIMGHSAGGHLASTVATHSPEATRPNFQILFYPVISMDKEITHMDSHNCLIGEDATPELEQLYSNDLQVTAQTPPALLILSDDDPLVSPRNAGQYYLALKKAGVKASMYVYPSGGHGYGCGPWFKYRSEMLKELNNWLQTILNPEPPRAWPPKKR